MSRRVLVTGAARGIGAAIAERFSAEGWDVIAPPRNQLDLAEPASIAHFLDTDGSTRVDAIINNAGENTLGSIETLPMGDLQRMMQTNFYAPWSLVANLTRYMRDQRWGRIVNIASVYGIKSRAARGAYNATKSAMIGFTKTAAIELGGHGVLVNAVAPGFVETAMTRTNNTAEDIADLCRDIPVGRLARPAEIAELVLWLASERNTYLTGQTIAIDGGFLAG